VPERTTQSLGLARRAVFEGHRREGERTWIQATGTSMQPLIEPGDWMHVDFGERHPRVGDIALFELSGAFVAHRVVGRRRRDGRALLVCKGDAVALCDPAVAPGAVFGVVRALRPAGGGVARTKGCAGMTVRVLAVASYCAGRWAWWTRRVAGVLSREGAST
jgi:peptidase S24-like protein